MSLVIWQCDKCNRTMTGFLPSDRPVMPKVGPPRDGRVCGSNYIKGRKYYPLRVKKRGELALYACNGTMRVVVDERNPNEEANQH